MDRYKHGEFSSADSIRLDESLKYTTLKGRPVYGPSGNGNGRCTRPLPNVRRPITSPRSLSCKAPDRISDADAEYSLARTTILGVRMADPTTGYIRISSFGAETPQEFIDAYNDLLDKGMKNLIIDLQDNGGGYGRMPTFSHGPPATGWMT